MSRRRAILELTLTYTLILLVIWTPNPIQRVLYITAVIVLAAILAFSFESCDKLGLRLTNLSRSLWIAVAALVLAGIIILIAAHLHTLRAPHSARRFIARYWGYALWAFVQQILLQDVFLRRLLILIPSPRRAALAAALIFALAHLPNPILTPITFLWGLISCLLFLRYRNIIPLAIAHAALGITLAITIPAPLLHNMRVGLGFLHYRVPHLPGAPSSRRSDRGQLGSQDVQWPTNRVPHLRDSLIVAKVGIRAKREPAERAGPPHRSHIPHTVSTTVCVTADAPTRLS